MREGDRERRRQREKETVREGDREKRRQREKETERESREILKESRRQKVDIWTDRQTQSVLYVLCVVYVCVCV